jgi:hypothetical protein
LAFQNTLSLGKVSSQSKEIESRLDDAQALLVAQISERKKNWFVGFQQG